MGFKKLNTTSVLAVLLSAIGALNWGLTGLVHLNLLRKVFGKGRALEQLVYGMMGLAGAWTIFQLVVPTFTTILSGRRHGSAVPPQRPSIVGQRLPTLEGQTLSGQHVRLPDDAADSVALLAMGFSYAARWDVENWVDAFSNRFADRDDVTFYEMPMIGGLARLAKPMIEAGMRRGTPASLQDQVVTIYGSMGPIRKALGITEESDTWIFLIDRDGTVLFESRDGLEEARFERLATVAELTLSSDESHSGRTVA